MSLLRTVSLLCLLLLGQAALGHDSRPLFIEVRETTAGLLQMHWKTPPSLPRHLVPDIVLPVDCRLQGRVAESMSGEGITRRGVYQCGSDLSGQTLTIAYPAANPSLSTLIRYHGAKGQTHTGVLAPGELSWRLPDSEKASRVVGLYTLLGIEHILLGFDHLLFLVCLLWVAGGWRRILLTVTGFTVAHSLTLVLSALALVDLPVVPVEAVIALSILFLVREIALGRKDSLTWRYPIAVSSSFGLLHGFGFAYALRDVGLPQTEVPLALLFFNVGVEVGQILFVVTVMVLGWVMARVFTKLAPGQWVPVRQRVAAIVLNSVGVLSGFWVVERVAAFI